MLRELRKYVFAFILLLRVYLLLTSARQTLSPTPVVSIAYAAAAVLALPSALTLAYTALSVAIRPRRKNNRAMWDQATALFVLWFTMVVEVVLSIVSFYQPIGIAYYAIVFTNSVLVLQQCLLLMFVLFLDVYHVVPLASNTNW